MRVHVVSSLAVLALLAAAPALAQGGVTPGLVLAAKGKHAKGNGAFIDRTARISSIVGQDLMSAAPLRVPTKPAWNHGSLRRSADAAAGLRQ